MSPKTLDTAATVQEAIHGLLHRLDPLGGGIENKRETQIPTSDWIGHNAQWALRRNSVSYPLVVQWVA